MHCGKLNAVHCNEIARAGDGGKSSRPVNKFCIGSRTNCGVKLSDRCQGDASNNCIFRIACLMVVGHRKAV